MHPSSALVDRSRHTILVVDDDEAGRYATAKHLRHAGFQTREAATGEEAIALVDAVHAVVLDVHLPGMSGLDVCERLRSLDGHLDLPILQCSGIFTRDADKVAGLRSGADAYLTKPVDEQLLIANLDALLRNRERLRRLADQLEDTRRQEDKARDLFLAVLGHDLRGPLDAILMSATLMVRTEESSPTALRIASRILSSGDRMKQMLEDLHDYARVRLGSGLSLSREPVNLGAVVTAVVDEIEAASPSARIVLKDGAGTVGKWDRAKLSRLVMNLLRNAVQYGDPEQAILVVLDESDGNARLRIENAGDPIPADVLSQIFEPMTRGDADVQRRGTNLGLGLFICRQIVDAHGGNISVRSDAAGTHFLVLLPC